MQYTVIWQSADDHARAWIHEIFGPYIKEHVVDAKHQVVLDNAILVDTFVDAHPLEYYARFRGKNAFLVQNHDEFLDMALNACRNFRGVFRNHVSRAFHPDFFSFFPIGYTPETACADRSTLPRATNRRYLWSFLGDCNKTTRPEMVQELRRIEPHFFLATRPMRDYAFMEAGPQGLPTSQYSELLRQSVFAPSPMGNASIECFRTYEALEQGAIPIVEKRLTLDYYRMLLGDHPLPTVSSWSEARQLITSLLKDPARMDALQSECSVWWVDYKLRLSASVGEFLEHRNQSVEIPEKLVADWGHPQLWRACELLRHHNLPAVLRRIQRNSTRLLTTGKLRVAWTRNNPCPGETVNSEQLAVDSK